ncbi:hypothetical protein HN51_049857 [Arachis hypogaea]|uniref:Sororin C-terminal region domain-containing protein n=1 Tax=Arachis hypogaea TaxID=3818 RepID=A0A444YDR4_ARAHY|nr:pectinesterase inhibitor 10-like isoform X2 [Arachis ipaensis]XP_025667256.1 pectinesterase inhibitor 10 isoform X2 [Arachis hypogaea]QHN91474.1 uncharacterized protein DS421_17g575120 [Arachis hypogaea]RYR00060.1 hypothetical protein Ahy_B07g088108 isoform A [Arachis hypogaea]
MEADRSTKRRNPLSDRTNTLNSSSPISINLIKPKPKPKSKPPSSTSSKPRLNKPSSRASSTNAATNLQSTSSNPAVAPPPPSSPITSSPPGNFVDLEDFEPISVTYSRRSAPNKRKDKGKALAFPDISTPILKLSDTRPKTDDGKSANLPKAKALTVPLRKKQRTTSSEDMLKDSELQDYIEKQKAYFKMIDEFELMEEEVETDDEPDEVEKTQSKCN